MPNPGASGLVHPGLTGALQASGFHPSTVTIRRTTNTRSGTGQVNPGFVTLPGHTAIPCRDAPFDNRNRGGDQIRRTNGEIVVNPHRIALNGHYPAIRESDAARLDGVDRDIVAVDHDDQTRTTYLTVERVH